MDSDVAMILVNFAGVIFSLMIITMNPRWFLGWLLLAVNGGVMIFNLLIYLS